MYADRPTNPPTHRSIDRPINQSINGFIFCTQGGSLTYSHLLSFASKALQFLPVTWISIRPKKKNCYIGVTRPTLKLGPTLHFFFFKNQKKKRQKNDRPILKKAKPVIFLFKHLILALKMLIWGFETWLVA